MMPIREIKFTDYDEIGKAGETLSFDIDENDFKITSSVTYKQAILSNETVEGIGVDTVELFDSGNSVRIHIPIDIPAGEYGFGVVLVDSNNLDEQIVCYTPEDNILISDDSGHEDTKPVIENVSFLGGLTSVKVSELLQTPLVITGEYLDSLTHCSLSRIPSVVFSCVSKTPFQVTFKATNIPPIATTTFTYVDCDYTIEDVYGVVVESGSISAPQQIVIIV